MKNNKLSKLDNLKLRTSTVGLRTKLGIIAIVCLLLSAGFSGVNATIKLGEDGSGQKWFGADSGLITNSNGKAWAATGTNLQTAIWDLNATGGKVRVAANITLSSQIVGNTDVILDFQNHKIVPSSSFDMVLMKPAFKIINAIFDMTGMTYTHTVITFDGADTYTITDYNQGLENIAINNNGSIGTGILYKTDADGEYICWTACDNIWIKYLEYGIRLWDNTTTGGGTAGFINGNIFSNIFACDVDYPIFISQSDGAIDRNHFIGFNIQAGATPPPGVTVDGRGNSFTGVFWDYGVNTALNITAGATDTFYAGMGTENRLVDNGATSVLLQYDANALNIREINSLNPVSTSFFTSVETGGTPHINIYGYQTGIAKKYMRLSVDGNGFGTITAENSMHIQRVNDINGPASRDLGIFTYAPSGINKQVQIFGRNASDTAVQHLNLQWGDGVNDYGIIESSYGGVKIQDIILPISAPAYPVSGSCYWDESANKLYIYNATSASWKSTTLT